jgi:hypothetical protein
MAKQTLHRHRISRAAVTLVVGLVVVGCGAASTASRSALTVPAFTAAPIEGSPELTANELAGSALENATYRVAPFEGSPEATAVELGR